MKKPRIKKTIVFNSDKEWTDIQNSILIQYFNSLGLYETIHTNKVLFKRRAHKANDFLSITTKADFFKIVRMAEIKLIETENKAIKLEISIGLSYLIILSIGLGFSFCLGMIYFFNEIGLTTYLIIDFLVMILTFSIGYINISLKIGNLVHKLMKNDK